jgi:hypothetical protein
MRPLSTRLHVYTSALSPYWARDLEAPSTSPSSHLRTLGGIRMDWNWGLVSAGHGREGPSSRWCQSWHPGLPYHIKQEN